MEGGGRGVTRVLLVDDSPVDRRVVQLLLSSSACAGSFHVIAVDSAKKAMEFLGLKEEGKEQKQEQAIDMVLTDYCMPEMTGYELLKAIKALSPLKPIPVIVMSSENEPQRISRCMNAGAEDFIVKPLQSKDVQRLRNCSPASTQCCDAGSDGEPPLLLLPSDHVVVATAAASPPPSSRRRAHFAGVLHSSSVELSHYFPFLFKFILLVYAILCLGELLHRWSNGCFLNLWCA
uniref:Response regulatory domain-containing protein n=1 Tax=Oryza meridionalis TaxID=40149 RepID=A0A0E0DEP5_9ORYZ